MAQHQVRRLPVVEEDGRLVGIVAQADVARHGDDTRDRPGRRADLAVELGPETAASPARRGSPSFARKDSASGATPNEAWVSYAARTTLVALAALIGAAGSSASAATPMDGLRVYKPVADTYVTAARARRTSGAPALLSTPRRRRPRSCASG